MRNPPTREAVSRAELEKLWPLAYRKSMDSSIPMKERRIWSQIYIRLYDGAPQPGDLQMARSLLVKRNPFSATHTSWAQAELAARDALEERSTGWHKRVGDIIAQVSNEDLANFLIDICQNAFNAAHVAWAERVGVADKVSPITAGASDDWNIVIEQVYEKQLAVSTQARTGRLAAEIVEIRKTIKDDDLLNFMFKDAGAILRGRYNAIYFAPAKWLADQREVGDPPAYGAQQRRQIPKINPAGDDNPDREKAIDKYVEFQRLTPNKVGEFAASFLIPTRMRKVGKAKWVTYRSDKIDPATERDPGKPIDYIHEHDAGVCLYVPDGRLDTDVPHFITDVRALTKLGSCLGFAFVDADGNDGEGKGKRPLPELYCIPSGKALLVIQDKREILAIMWGGILGVEGRGIVG